MSEIVKAEKFDLEKIISQAVEKGATVETMERLLAMRKELKAEWAKEQFDISMMEFQSDCPQIKKTREVKTNSGAVAYRYAPIESIAAQVKDLLKKYGFSYSTETETQDKNVKVTCVVKHRDGHSESKSVAVPLGTKTAVMSDTQVVAAAMTFAKRYAFCNAFGILTSDDDIDGKEILIEDSPKSVSPETKTDFNPPELTGKEKAGMIAMRLGQPIRDVIKQIKMSGPDAWALCVKYNWDEQLIGEQVLLIQSGQVAS